MWKLHALARTARVAHALRPVGRSSLPSLLHARRLYALHSTPPCRHASDAGGATGGVPDTWDDDASHGHDSGSPHDSAAVLAEAPAEGAPSAPEAAELDALPLPVYRPYHAVKRGTAKPDLMNLMYDASSPADELVLKTVEDFRKVPGIISAQVPFGHHFSKQVADLVDLRELDKAEQLMEDPMVERYPLHRMDVISDAVSHSVQSRLLLYRYLSQEDVRRMQRRLSMDEEAVQVSPPGKCVHFQLVHPAIATAAPRRRDARDAAQSAAPRLTPAQQAEVKAARDVVERVLRRYVARVLEPQPNELVVDLSHYAAFLPLLNSARRNFLQMKKDVADYLEGRPVTKEGIAGPSRRKDLEPMSPDDLAAEIARVIRRELPALQPRGSDSGSDGNAASGATRPILHLCIGVATTPIVAKIASDVEAASVLAKLREAATTKAKAKAGAAAHDASSSSSSTKEAIPRVSIRSFHRHLRSLKASRDFMARFPVRHIPGFSPAFVELLRRVFGITTCGQLYEKRMQLYGTFSHETAQACYNAAYGHMRYVGEDEAGLHAPSNLVESTRELRAVASNAITVVNEDRTAFMTQMMQFMPRATVKRQAMRGWTVAAVPIGRLAGGDAIRHSVAEAARIKHRQAYTNGNGYTAVRVSLHQRSRPAVSHSVELGENATEQQLLEAVKSEVTKLLPHFDRANCTGQARPASIQIMLTGVHQLPMVPPPMLKEAGKIVKMCVAAKFFLCKRKTIQLLRGPRRRRRWTSTTIAGVVKV